MSTSFNHEFCFIHIPKCGGLSVEKYLYRTMPSMQSTSARHVPLSELAKAGLPPQAFKKIVGLIRNPYEQQVSQWAFWKEEHDRGKRSDSFKFAHSTPFKEWVKEPLSNFGCGADYGQGIYHWWLNVDGDVPDNVELLKLEEIDKLPALLKDFQVLEDEIPHINTSKHKEWQHYYDDETKDVVQNKFNWIFERGLYER